MPLLHVRLAIAERELGRRGERGHHAGDDVETSALLADLDEVVFAIDPRQRRLLRVSPAAARVIELLTMLQAKTKGNLLDQEAKLIDDLLYELRLRFVQAQQGGKRIIEP